jgi:hypothetical protein
MSSGALSLCVFPLVVSAEDLPKAYDGESRTTGQKASRHCGPITSWPELAAHHAHIDHNPKKS